MKKCVGKREVIRMKGQERLNKILTDTIEQDAKLKSFREPILNFVTTYTLDIGQLWDLKLSMLNEEPYRVISGLETSLIEYEQGQLNIKSSKNIEIPKVDGIRLVNMLIDIYTNYFPIGTVVKMPDELIDSYELPHDCLMILMQRLVPIPNSDYYAPYVATIYPNNFNVDSELFILNEMMLEDVVHLGYESDQDKLAVAHLKQQCIQEMGLKSFDKIPRIERMMTHGN